MGLHRRTLLRVGALLPMAPAGAMAAVEAPASLPFSALPPAQLAADSAYWAQVARLYDTTDEVVNLDNGYWGSMARPVLDAYQHHTAEVNRGNAWYGRTRFPAAFEAARARVASALGVELDEIALTRGATEALQALISGYNRLKPGDAVMYADVDYDGMILAMRWLEQRRGVEVKAIELPEPAAGHDAVLACYAQALKRHPNLKLLLLTHVNHRNGMRLPVAEIADMARQRGVDVIVDAAHSFGQLDVKIPDMRADFVGINLHKWIGAPVGVGALYIKRGRVGSVDPYMGERDGGDVRSRVHTGTVNFAAYLALPLALDLHEKMGAANKQARLQHLRNRWVEAARELKALEVLASPDPRLTSAIAAFRLRGQTGLAQNFQLCKRIAAESGVFTVFRDGLASGSCVRVTPAIYTSDAQIDQLIAALRTLRV